MPVDYSKWDKIESSDEEKDDSKAKSSGDGGQVVKLREDELTDDVEDIPCPLEELEGVWDSLTLEKKQRVMEHLQKQASHLDSPSRYHPAKSLHKSLFDPAQWRRWIHPGLLSVLDSWEESKPGRPGKGPGCDFKYLDLDAFEGLRVEAPGIISFPAFTDEFCQFMNEEVRHCHTSGVPTRQPNGMNNYGMVLNDIGLRPVFNTFLHEVFRPMGARLFGDSKHRVTTINGASVGTEDWGGSTLDTHHTFIVEYKPDGDRHLDMHIDSCDVTFNFGISTADNFQGSDLTFCGMFHNDDHRLHHFSYRHERGRCVVHSGKRRHGARDIEGGERSSLVMWTHSETFRRSRIYEERHRRMVKDGLYDKVCLSYTHDADYKRLMPQKQQFHMKSKEELESDHSSVGSSSTRVPLTQKTWMVICKDSELPEGGAKMRFFEKENEQVAVFRHRGELFAIDNRCAHMGGPLCEGDIEDLGNHTRRSGKSRPQNWKDGVVRCPRHGMCFNIRTGENINGSPFGKSGFGKQKLYPVRLSADGQNVEVEVELEVDSALTSELPHEKDDAHSADQMHHDLEPPLPANSQRTQQTKKGSCSAQ